MRNNPANFAAVAQEELKKTEQLNHLSKIASAVSATGSTRLREYGDERQQAEARTNGGRIRSASIDALAALLEQFEAKATQNGIKVLWADDGVEACDLIGQIVEKHQVKLITKGKSMIGEEIEINHFLTEKYGTEIYEGDLGELIVQQRGGMPFHIVGPAMNLTLPEIAQTLSEKIAMPYSEEIPAMVGYVRRFMRGKFQGSQMGITGVNQAVAATGSLLLVENEGNIRWVTSAPRIHVALMSIEKVCANMSDAFYLLGLLTRSCTGQAMTSYLSVLNGPRRAEEEDGPDELYVVIIDNNRSAAYQNEQYKEAMRCIRCGRCGFQCPIYMTVGSTPYGWCYPGPMGTVLAPLVLGPDATRDLYEACTLCGGCQSVCPTRVPHVDLLLSYRAENQKRHGSVVERMGYKVWAKGVESPALYQKGLKLVRNYLIGKSRDGVITKLPKAANPWLTVRDFPAPEAKSFREKWRESLGAELAKNHAQASPKEE